MRPIYETTAEKAHERAVINWLKPKLIRTFEREWGPIRLDTATGQLDHADHELHFDTGVLFLEVKNRTARFATYMISENKILDLQTKVAEARSRGLQSRAFVVVTYPHAPHAAHREAVAFNCEASYAQRKMGGRDDRRDGIDREFCRYFDWDVAVPLGHYEFDEQQGVLSPVKL